VWTESYALRRAVPGNCFFDGPNVKGHLTGRVSWAITPYEWSDTVVGPLAAQPEEVLSAAHVFHGALASRTGGARLREASTTSRHGVPGRLLADVVSTHALGACDDRTSKRRTHEPGS
jgi:hypothetical protein